MAEKKIYVSDEPFYLIDKGWYHGNLYGLYESDLFGDDVPAAVVNVTAGYVCVDTTYDSLSTWANDYFDT